MGKRAEKCAVKAVIRYDNGDVLEVEYVDLLPEVSIALVELLQSNKLEPSDG